MKVFFSKPTIKSKEKEAVLEVLNSGWLTSGPKTIEFEQALKKYIGCKFVKVLNSCTSALNLALLSLNLKKTDQVITTPFTFCATVNAIIHAGAKPIFADIDKDTFNIKPEYIEKKITKKTKAILVMHYGGLPCDMDEILEISKKYKLAVIEDAAHALGSQYHGKKIGSLQTTSCFSFHATKTLTTAEGGAIATANKKIFDFINKAYFHGIDIQSWQRQKNQSWQYKVTYPGFKYNLSDILAAIGLEQIKELDNFIKKREKIASLYTEAFKNNEFISYQKVTPNKKHSYYLYSMLLNLEKLSIDRNRFIEELKKRNIHTSVHFIPIYKHPAYKKFFTKNDLKQLKNTEYVYQRIVSLPIYPLLTKNQINYVISSINDIIKKYRR
ncbi:MAG: DegT/DnrJ/EryC1/StrS aminotransferase family protein [Candidatus Omnitrophica bacterium]|nr:DegT/DnrJ/EryC1/StrS aminotransferase family protein [Candidatus Omnitrophota bacterium]